MKAQDYQISSDLFKLHSKDVVLHDEALKTKPVSYLKDALYRFTRNKSSIVAFVIIVLLFLFAMITPLFCTYEVSDFDTTYAFALPRNEFNAEHDIEFWDGAAEKDMSEQQYLLYKAIEQETKMKVFRSDIEETESVNLANKKVKTYVGRVDSYSSVGVKFLNITKDEFVSIQKFQDESGLQVLLPITIAAERPGANQDNKNANYWYKTELKGGKTYAKLDANGDFINIYTPYSGTDGYTSTLRIEGSTPKYDYSEVSSSGYRVRVIYYNYYIYMHQYINKDKIERPSFVLGATNTGKDLLTCLANGARFSFVMAIIVSVVNLFVGAIIGAIEGYYGGAVDIIIERISDILGSIPFMVVISLMRIKLKASQAVILFMAFFATGWMGMAGRTRMQFYRFKNQEYVLVSRTLGAKDSRVMFKHIFPNAIGTLITGSILSIPGVIFSETSLSYLGIINLETGNITSVGTLLSTGQNFLFTYPHIIIWPAIFISLLMLSFNLFGNGLRDAFNPSLRGAEE